MKYRIKYADDFESYETFETEEQAEEFLQKVIANSEQLNISTKGYCVESFDETSRAYQLECEINREEMKDYIDWPRYNALKNELKALREAV